MKPKSIPSPEVRWAVLINEDPAQLVRLADLTRKAGLEPLTFQDAAAALAFLDPQAPTALVITDISMSSPDGWRFCRMMRSREYAPFNQVPILVVSATFAGEDPVRIAADLGADAYLSAPVDDQVFIEMIHNILAGTVRRMPLRALIVEDDLDVSLFLRRVFGDNGYQVDCVGTLREAAAAGAGENYDVALIDYRLPDGDGDTFLDLLHAHRPECICIMFTGAPSAELSLDWMKRGAAACVTKPFEPSYLLELCARARRERALLRTEHLLDLRTHELQESLKNFQALYDAMDELVVVASPKGSVLYTNRAASQQLGYSTEDLRSLPLMNWIPANRRAEAETIFAAMLRGEQDTCSLPLITKAGELLPAETRSWASTWGGEACLVCMVRLLSPAEKALRESGMRFRQLAAQSHTFLWDVDNNGLYTYVDPMAETIIGYRPEELIGKKHFFDLAPAEDRDAVRTFGLSGIGKGLAITSYVNRFVTKDNRVIWVSTTAQSLRGAQDEIIGARGADTDITDRKQWEILQETNREILQILNEPGTLQESIQRVLSTLKNRLGFDAVGLRLEDKEYFPYFVQDGFSDDFLLVENSLLGRSQMGGVCRDQDGNICLEGACGLVLSGKTDPSHPLCTKKGSFWTNDFFPFLDLKLEEELRHNPRNTCIHKGYASVALVPIRVQDTLIPKKPSHSQEQASSAHDSAPPNGKIVGLIQMNDRRKGRFTRDTIEILEDIALSIGSALIRKHAEEEYRTLFYEMMDGFAEHEIICDDAGIPVDYRYLAVNPAFERMTGLSSEMILHRTVLEVMPNTEPYWIENYGRVVLTGKPLSFENYSAELKKYFTGTAFRTAPDRFATISRDITESKRMSEQLQQALRMESIGRLAGGVAHDFNNMLQAILGTAEMAMHNVETDSAIHADLAEIRRIGKRSADLTLQLLAFARKQNIVPILLNLNEAVESMLKMLRRLIGEHVQLVWKPSTEPGWVRMDPSQLDQILANLCVNARDAISDTGEINIETSLKTLDEAFCAQQETLTPGPYLCLAVSDSGHGMDEKTLKHLFEPFFTTKGLGKGTGLGLATVYGIVKQNQGHITVHSALGLGTSFEIFLPIQTAADTLTTNLGEVAMLLGGTETILLAEDEKEVLEICRRFLKMAGYTVLAAETPTEALLLAGDYNAEIHLLVSDMVMPDMSGVELQKALLAQRPSLRTLFITGYTSHNFATPDTTTPKTLLLSKPFSQSDLLAKVREALDRVSPCT